MDLAYNNIRQYLQGHPKVVKGILIGMVPVLSITSALGLTGCKEEPITPTNPPKQEEQIKGETIEEKINNPTQLGNYTIPNSVDAGKDYNIFAELADKDGLKEVYISLKKNSEEKIIGLIDKDNGLYEAVLNLEEGGWQYKLFAVDSNHNSEEVYSGSIVVEKPELTYKDKVLVNLQEYHKRDPALIYSNETLDTMLNFAENNKSLISDYDKRHFYILTEFIKDNSDAINHPIAVNQYVREIDDLIFDYCRIKSLDDKVGGYDNKYVRDAINLNWSNFVEAENKGELINSLYSGKMDFLPRAIFLIDIEQRKDIGDTNPRYDENQVENLPNLVEVAYKNIKYFQKRHDETWYIATHLDKPLEVDVLTGVYLVDNKSVHKEMYDNPVFSSAWPNCLKKSRIDIETLMENGSDTVKTWIKVYGNAAFKNRGHDEDRVEGGIADLWTIGVPAYRVRAKYPSRSGSSHGELAGPLTQHDINLLMSISDEELFIEPKTQTMTPLWTRKSNVIEDGTPLASIVMSNNDNQYFFRLGE